VQATCAGTLVTGSSGTVTSPSLPEVSGVAASRANPGVLWVHNDSGDTARVFALDQAGEVLRTLNISGASASDWEDIAIGPGPDKKASYLYAGDIGDNAVARSSIAVYRILEPTVDPLAGPLGTSTLLGAERLTFTYPDGPHNAETLLVDTDGSIYIVTKDFSGISGIFRAPPGLAGGSTTVLTAEGTADMAGLAVGGDIAPAGDAILMRTYGDVYMYARPAGSTIAATLAGARCQGALANEPQGEAIAFAADGNGYLTMSEGTNQPINTYRVP
jgi:hypothetical protein